MSHHIHLNIKKKKTQSENNMVFLGYGNNQGELLMKRGNCLLLNRMNIIPSCKSFPANTRSTVMWFIGTVLLLHALHACSFCALVKWYTARRRVRACYRRRRATKYNIWQDMIVRFLRWETFYFITRYENNNRIMTLTLNLSTSHLTADTESGQRVFLRHSHCIWQKCQQLSCTSFKIKVSHQKSI